jgi:hypothetical protein
LLKIGFASGSRKEVPDRKFPDAQALGEILHEEEIRAVSPGGDDEDVSDEATIFRARL